MGIVRSQTLSNIGFRCCMVGTMYLHFQSCGPHMLWPSFVDFNHKDILTNITSSLSVALYLHIGSHGQSACGLCFKLNRPEMNYVLTCLKNNWLSLSVDWMVCAQCRQAADFSKGQVHCLYIFNFIPFTTILQTIYNANYEIV